VSLPGARSAGVKLGRVRRSAARASGCVAVALSLMLPAGPMLVAATASPPFIMENAELHAVVEEIAKLTGTTFVFDPARVKGKITVIAPGAMTPARALDLLRSALALHGYALVTRAEGLWIVPAPAPAEDTVVQVIPLQHAVAHEVASTLAWVAPAGVRIAPYSAANAVVISGPGAAVEALVDIIRGR
jgi:general secretion pathway protein D